MLDQSSERERKQEERRLAMETLRDAALLGNEEEVTEETYDADDQLVQRKVRSVSKKRDYKAVVHYLKELGTDISLLGGTEEPVQTRMFPIGSEATTQLMELASNLPPEEANKLLMNAIRSGVVDTPAS